MLAIGASGCPGPVTWSFPHANLTEARPPLASRTVVGRKAVLRLRQTSGPDGNWGVWAMVDLFPPEATLRGAWARVARDDEVHEGPATLSEQTNERSLGRTPRYVVRWSLDPTTRGAAPSGTTATLWLGPVCVADDCETFRFDDADWRALRAR